MLCGVSAVHSGELDLTPQGEIINQGETGLLLEISWENLYLLLVL